MFTDLTLQVALMGQELWAVAKSIDLSLQAPMAGTKLADLSLQSTPYKEDKKNLNLKRSSLVELSIVLFQLDMTVLFETFKKVKVAKTFVECRQRLFDRP